MNAATTDTGKTNGSAKADPEFVEVQLDRVSLNFERQTERSKENPKIEVYKGKPVQGYLAACMQVGHNVDDDGNKRPRFAYVFQLTAPAKAYDRDDKEVEAKAGEEVLLWPNHQLDQAIAIAAGVPAMAAANNPQYMLHIKVTPVQRAPMKSSERRLWHFRVAIAPKPVKRLGKSVLNLLAGSAQPAALPPVTEVDEEINY